MVYWIWDMVEVGKVFIIVDFIFDYRFYNEDFIWMVEIGFWCI